MPRKDLIAVRRGTAAEWTAANPVLAAGEPGLEIDTGIFKVGDGQTPWLSLDPISSAPGVRPPAFVIAAADAPAEVKAAADVVCDGVDDDVEIQAALDAGRSVVLSEGTFWINGHAGGRVLMPSGSVLRGQGPQRTVIRLQPADLGNETLFPPLGSWGVVGTPGTAEAPVEDVTLADLTIDGNHQNMLSLGNENQGECFNGKHTVRLKVTNVHVVNANADGFDLDFCSGVLTNVSALNCRGNGIHLSGGLPAGADETATRWVVVQGADIEGCGFGFTRYAFDITTDSAYCVLQGITCRGNRATCVIAGNRNVVTGLIADDGAVTITGDFNVLNGFQLRGGSNVGIGRMLIIVGTGNRVANGRIETFSGTSWDGTDNAGVNIHEIGFTAPIVETSAVGTRLTNYCMGAPPTTNSTSTRWGQSWAPEGASENRGTATIPDGETSVAIAHGLWTTPVVATVTPRALDQVAVTARDADTITISRAGTSGDLDVDWAARV